MRPDELAVRGSDVHYEVALDPEPDMAPVPVGEIVTPAVPDRLPVVPGWARPGQFRHHAARLGYAGLCHATRTPEYLFWTVVWTPAGVLRLAGRALRWWWLIEQHGLRSEAAAAGDSREWMRLHREAKETRKVRGMVLAAVLAVLAAAVAVAVHEGYWWVPAAAGVAAVPWLAHIAHPADKPILRPAVLTPRFRVLNADVVLRAYYAAGLGSRDKPEQQVTFGSAMSREGDGSGVDVDLPYGKGLGDAMKARPAIASGLDVTESQVFIHRDPTSHRRHHLWIADRDPLAVPVGRTPLLACRPADIWKPAPFGLDERGQVVTVPLMWHSILVSALPRAGKTFSARLLALYAALDPYVQLDVFDFKGSPDWRKFALVADSFGFGLTVSRHGDPLEVFGRTLERISADVHDRNHRLSELADRHPDLCPEGKLTRQLARDPRLRMPVRMLVLDEFQEVYDLGDASKEVASLLTHVVKIAPSAGYILLDSTQRPSGVGSGPVAQHFTSFRDNHALRFGLRTSSWQVSELCLGAGAYSEGLDTSALLPQYKGVGILRGATDASPTVRTYLADGQDAERILTAARALRERAGTLSGMAAGEAAPQPVSVLADVLAVLGEQTGYPWEVLAPLLARRFPERHADATAESVSAQCRAAGVPSVDVKYMGRALKGCRRADVMAAVDRDGQR